MAQALNISTLGTGPNVVLLHGWGLNHGVFKPLAQQLAQHYQVTLIDLPGYGDNVSHALPSYSFKAVVDAIAQVVESQSILVGWSLGGLVATALALHYPEKVSGLVTIASSPAFVAQDNWPGIKPDVLKSFHQQLSVDAGKTIDGFLKIQAMGSPHLRQDVKTIRQLIMEFDQPSQFTLDQSLALLETVDLRDKLSQITVPWLRLYGSTDSLVPKAVIQQVNELTPKSDWHLFEKASHAPFISHESEFVSVLTDWLNLYKLAFLNNN